MTVIETTSVAPADWDTYVVAHPLASAYHRSAAVAIGATTFRLRTAYMTARDAERNIVGVLPVVEQSSPLFGRFLVSLPFFTYGGILAGNETTAVALADAAAELAGARRLDHVELRHSAPMPGLILPERLDKVSMVLELPDNEAALSKQLGAKLRSQIRRAERENPEIVWGGQELLREFYDVFAPAMHRLGTPVYPRRFFDAAWSALDGLIHVIGVRVRGETQAAAVIVRHGARIEVPWAAATDAAKRAALNMRLYWEMLRRSVELQAEAFDFGRSTVDSGTYAFKAQWGAKPQQLHWHYWLRGSTRLPQLNGHNPKYALAIEAWRRMPLWCANLIGPRIVRYLP